MSNIVFKKGDIVVTDYTELIKRGDRDDLLIYNNLLCEIIDFYDTNNEIVNLKIISRLDNEFKLPNTNTIRDYLEFLKLYDDGVISF